jgi:hypothetical protein
VCYNYKYNELRGLGLVCGECDVNALWRVKLSGVLVCYGDSLAKSSEDLVLGICQPRPVSVDSRQVNRADSWVLTDPLPFTSAADTVTYRNVETQLPSTTIYYAFCVYVELD